MSGSKKNVPYHQAPGKTLLTPFSYSSDYSSGGEGYKRRGNKPKQGCDNQSDAGIKPRGQKNTRKREVRGRDVNGT